MKKSKACDAKMSNSYTAAPAILKGPRAGGAGGNGKAPKMGGSVRSVRSS
jgi:hypothetical protein